MRLIKRLVRPTRVPKVAFRAGEVLRLKSGGRPMTASWSGPVLFAPGNWLICQWISDAGELQQEMFPEETLERASHALAA
ncbi:YodC family protein [Paraburkholderia sp. BCC1884]|uniref:YodC family protein n=1 Tax=Paraburkholderia sp. BCC1884 TaxID=2562668 RepID=UPI00118401FD|nr:YodC family protein [Paraburkholderia sp. BCC1884]